MGPAVQNPKVQSAILPGSTSLRSQMSLRKVQNVKPCTGPTFEGTKRRPTWIHVGLIRAQRKSKYPKPCTGSRSEGTKRIPTWSHLGPRRPESQESLKIQKIQTLYGSKTRRYKTPSNCNATLSNVIAL